MENLNPRKNNLLVEALAIIVTLYLVYLIYLYFPYHWLSFHTAPSPDIALEKARELELAEIKQAQKDADSTTLKFLYVAWVACLGFTIYLAIEIFRQ